MRAKILRAALLRPILTLGGWAGLWLLLGTRTPGPPMPAPDSQLQAPGSVSGRLTLLDKGDRQAEDVGQAVIWLGTRQHSPMPVKPAQVSTADKEFSPHMLVVPLGSTITFDNHDPFNHNVFSLSEGNPFDLGMYGRGETRSVKFGRAGIVRIYCNVHPQMSALVVVRDNPYYGQPSSDGSFSIPSVPPGRYTLHAWHERSSEMSREIEVPAGGIDSLELELDARGYKFKPHLNKFGRPYPQEGRRY
jgi:plastocyanin